MVFVINHEHTKREDALYQTIMSYALKMKKKRVNEVKCLGRKKSHVTNTHILYLNLNIFSCFSITNKKIYTWFEVGTYNCIERCSRGERALD